MDENTTNETETTPTPEPLKVNDVVQVTATYRIVAIGTPEEGGPVATLISAEPAHYKTVPLSDCKRA